MSNGIERASESLNRLSEQQKRMNSISSWVKNNTLQVWNYLKNIKINPPQNVNDQIAAEQRSYLADKWMDQDKLNQMSDYQIWQITRNSYQ